MCYLFVLCAHIHNHNDRIDFPLFGPPWPSSCLTLSSAVHLFIGFTFYFSLSESEMRAFCPLCLPMRARLSVCRFLRILSIAINFHNNWTVVSSYTSWYRRIFDTWTCRDFPLADKGHSGLHFRPFWAPFQWHRTVALLSVDQSHSHILISTGIK